MENEIMEYEEMNDIEAIETDERSGMSTGGAMLLGAALTAAGIAVGNLIKKGIAAYKAKKELKKSEVDAVESDSEDESK